MTKETLQEANKLNRAISELEHDIAIVDTIHHCDRNMTLEVGGIGTITIACDDELKGDILDMVLKRLSDKHEDMEDKLRLL